MFIGREIEIEALRNKFKSHKKTVILLYGRRRIGKTALIRETLKDINDATVVYHEFHRVIPEKNIEEFSKSIGEALSLSSLPPFLSLTDAFVFLNQLGKRMIVVMDEYSELKIHAKKGEIDSYMKSIVDNLSENIILILTGSSLKVMEELLEEENPMFGRFTYVMKLEPLDYYDASNFFPDKSHYEQMEIYSVFGGSPYVLSLLDEHLSLRENIEETIIPLSGSVRAYVESVINMEASRVPHGITILALISNSKKKYSELENTIGKNASGVLNRELKMLIELGIVGKVQPINKKDKAKIFYEITDPVIRFYFTYIYPNPELMMTNPNMFFENFIKKSIKDFIARRFEEACRSYFALLVKNGIRYDIMNIGTYWYDDEINKRKGEFDVALQTAEGYEIYDAKFVSAPLSYKETEKERRQLSTIPISLTRWGIISASGFEEKNNSYTQLTLDDLYKASFSRHSEMPW
ncbi:MAG: AAA family ATPase [Spirochaetes bacterium]|uniref:AAA family ATPase n=1 Tax=Candidatus Ornithospirochaeta stercoripullorum TaxID=2840899 RepID=A0A9D9E318_9SPIO|nr:AAA family ATPase [Candidatus Ornithospirochaeta stercoripullorum]